MLTRCLQGKGSLSCCTSKGVTEGHSGTTERRWGEAERISVGKGLLRIEQQGCRYEREEELVHTMSI